MSEKVSVNGVLVDAFDYQAEAGPAYAEAMRRGAELGPAASELPQERTADTLRRWKAIRRGAWLYAAQALAAGREARAQYEQAREILRQTDATADPMVSAVLGLPPIPENRVYRVLEQAGTEASNEDVSAAVAAVKGHDKAAKARREARRPQRKTPPIKASVSPTRKPIQDYVRQQDWVPVADLEAWVEAQGLKALSIRAMLRDGELRKGRGDVVGVPS